MAPRTPRFGPPPEERAAWIMLALAVVGYPAYLVLLFTGADGGAPGLAGLDFAGPMLWTVGGSILASFVLSAVFRVFTDPESNERDERDRQIGRWADLIGQALVIAGALGGLVLAMLEAHVFWIANAIFLGFYLSAMLGSISRIIAYRTGFSATW